MKVAVEEDKCCGAGACVMASPEVFDQRDEDGIVVLLEAQPSSELHGTVREAADMCPTRAIGLTED